MILYSIIQTAIDKTSLQFDNNIEANRFDHVENHYEVTIKCKSSRGKGAKLSPLGRHLTSCCWHVWGTFFDELFKLNPDIVIIAQGNRITKDYGNWIDRDVGQGRMESEMCECEPEPDPVQGEPSIRCSVCRHSINTTGVPCTIAIVGRCTSGSLFERIPQESIEEIHRHCTTCRFSVTHNPGRVCDKTDRCSERQGFPLWEKCNEHTCSTCKHSMLHHWYGRTCGKNCHAPDNPMWELFVPNWSVDILSETYYDHGGRFYSKPSGALIDTEPTRFKVPEEE